MPKHSADGSAIDADEIDRRASGAKIVKAAMGGFTRVRRSGDGPRDGMSSIKAKLLLVIGCKCEACGASMPSGTMLHLHHIVPVARGGPTEMSNSVLLCPNCHAKAHWIDRALKPSERPTSRAEIVHLLTTVVRRL